MTKIGHRLVKFLTERALYKSSQKTIHCSYIHRIKGNVNIILCTCRAYNIGMLTYCLKTYLWIDFGRKSFFIVENYRKILCYGICFGLLGVVWKFLFSFSEWALDLYFTIYTVHNDLIGLYINMDLTTIWLNDFC